MSSQAGLLMGAMTMGAGGIGTYMGGAAGDRLARRDPRWCIGCLGVGAVASVPFTVVAYPIDDLTLTVVLLTIGMLGGEQALRYWLAVLNGFLLWSGVHHALVMRTYRDDLAGVAERA